MLFYLLCWALFSSPIISSTKTNLVSSSVEQKDLKVNKPSTNEKRDNKVEDGKTTNVDVAQDYKAITNLIKVMGLVKNNFHSTDKVDFNKLVEDAIKGIMDGLKDPYSTYLNAEDMKKLNIELLDSHTSGVIGVLMIKLNHIIIADVIDGGPAQKAGLKRGDRIIKVDGQDIESWSSEDCVNKITGKSGTSVKITVKRVKNAEDNNKSKSKEAQFARLEEKDKYDIFDISLKRSASIKISNLSYKMLGDDVGYIQLQRFSTGVADQIKDSLEKLQKSGAKYIVFDLRDNPGGTLVDALAVTSIFTDKTPIAGMSSASELEMFQNVGGSNEYSLNVPLTVLINGGSASASEVFSDAMRKLNRALLIGERTYGKGTVQSVVELNKDDPKSGAIKLTTANFLGPDGQTIDKVGVEPHLYIGFDSSVMKLKLDEDEKKIRSSSYARLDEIYVDILNKVDQQKAIQLETAVTLSKALKGDFSSLINDN